jgi:predicted phosphoadenosine phosphosulfate sulfurtransferase
MKHDNCKPIKRGLGINVLEAARQRIAWTFDQFERIYVSFSAGKDSTVMLHLVMEEAIRRQRRVGVLLVDLEGQYKLTVDHALACFHQYRDWIDPYWVCLPIHLRNAVSQFDSHWICWEPGKEEAWIRQPPAKAITDPAAFPFYHHAMEFEEFVPAFGDWYAQGQTAACFVGIRSRESLNRWRTIAGHGAKFDDRNYTSLISPSVCNIYPIYDWHETDLWTYHAKTQTPYNRLYDRMYQAGLTLPQMRICQPYGDDQRKGLWLFQVIEPETWARIVARVNGANAGALYAKERGNILGNFEINKPPGHTWKSFVRLLLDSMPDKTREHYEAKITIFIKWFLDRGQTIDDMADDGPITKGHFNWKRIAKALLRNDYWCKGLSFSPHRSTAYERYLVLMRKRREKWGIF